MEKRKGPTEIAGPRLGSYLEIGRVALLTLVHHSAPLLPNLGAADMCRKCRLDHFPEG